MAQDHLPEDLKPEDMAAIAAERQLYLTRGFWVSLLKGRESLGDTFWIGNYLSALIFLPVMIVIFMMAALVPAVAFLMPVAFILFGVFLLGVARAVGVAPSKRGLAWRVVGVAWTLMNALMMLASGPLVLGAT